jgi:hypothetical protein
LLACLIGWSVASQGKGGLMNDEGGMSLETFFWEK